MITATRLDPPRPVPISALAWSETSTGVYELAGGGTQDAVFEELTPGVFGLTDSPGSGTRARHAQIGALAIMYG